MLRSSTGWPPVSMTAHHVDAAHTAPSLNEVLPTRPAAMAALPAAPPILPNDLWGQVGQFMAHNDLLSLRTACRSALSGVDRAITEVHIVADRASALLGVIASSQSGLKHINAMRLSLCTNDNFPLAISALARVPHEKLNLRIERAVFTESLLGEAGLTHLRNIRPATLDLIYNGAPSPAEVRILASLDYPISLSVANYGAGQEDALRMLALADIPNLVSLHVESDSFDDAVARAFKSHRRIGALYLKAAGKLLLSDEAIAMLAGNPAIRILHIGAMRLPLGPASIFAIARNRSMTELSLDNVNRPLDASSALILSENTSLQTLTISLRDGYFYLARLASLKSLTLHGAMPIMPGDARLFAQAANLQDLDIVDMPFDGHARAIMAGAAVTSLKLGSTVFSAREITALLANRVLRRLYCSMTGFFPATVTHATALAAHRSLTSLTVWHGSVPPPSEGGFEHSCSRYDDYARINQADFFSMMTSAERAALLAAWGDQRSQGALRVNF